MKTMRRSVVVLGSVAAATVAAGIALGAIPGSGGVISGCYHKQLGVLRVIDVEGTPTKSCAGWERPLAWSQTGPAGAQGPKGDPGEDGVSGYEVSRSDDSEVLRAVDVTVVVSVDCPDDKVAIGGGVESLTIGPIPAPYLAAVIASVPTDDGTGWRTTVARIDPNDETPASVTGYAVCVRKS